MKSKKVQKVFSEYFAMLPWDSYTAKAQGFDMGCGSGRWARMVSPRVGRLHSIDLCVAIDVARAN
jgi:hypothetical protein